MFHTMTDDEWLSTTCVSDMHSCVRSILGDRKPQLYVAACGRLTTLPAPNDLLARASDAVERCADGEESPEAIHRLHEKAGKACSTAYHKVGNDSGPHFLALAALRMTDYPTQNIYVPHVPFFLAGALEKVVGASASEAAQQLHADLFRDIAGNPYRLSIRRTGRRARGEGPHHKINRRWLTPGVRGIAENIYAERAFELMPILADALEDAGCDSGDILSHCRATTVHVRGCWVVDLLLSHPS